ncbi:MAG: DUF488 domain-containing protein [Gemmatimonadaceae bacterium]|nr:DUF488 domain-containing protein [Gemmatimonadaceae bacterium]
MSETGRTLATIGYEGATVAGFVGALHEAGVQLVVDVRAVASSRRPGFAKTAMTANLAEAGIDYMHLRALGTPADGRAAARAGRHDVMREIFSRHLATWNAQEALHALAELVDGDRTLCLVCFERDPSHCHRTIVADAVAAQRPVLVRPLYALDARS